VAAALAAYPVVVAGALVPLVAVLAGLGLLSVLAAILSRRRFVGAALCTLATEYVVVESTGRAGVGSILAYAVGLILVSELLLFAAELPRQATMDRGLVLAAMLVLAAIAVAAALLALVVLAATTVRLPGGFEAALLGACAAVTLLALPVLQLRHGRVRAGRPSHQ
jgi:hypothetical protein